MPIGLPSAADSQKLVRRPTYFGWRWLQTGESIPTSVQYGKAPFLTQHRDNLSQHLPAIPDEVQPTRTRKLVAREKGQGKNLLNGT
ncbi:hypothetical protein N7523_009804 [Penicillium sp. IBT 18751x]|nr:hypothetical protein N7523_009804 [Penicillium sp. IBT 18751x]